MPMIALGLHVVEGLAIAALWLRKPGEDAGAAVAALRGEAREAIAGTRGRLDVLEERVSHMPTSEEFHEVKGQLDGIRERLMGLDDTAKTTRSTVQRIEDFLRENR